MARISQITMLGELERVTEDNLQQAIRLFQNMTDEGLNRPSSTGGWSVAQCMWHLNSYGWYYHPRIAESLRKTGPAPKDGQHRGTWLGGRFAKMMDPTTGKGRMKAFKANTPASTLDGRAVVAEFIAQQEALLGFLREARFKDVSSARIPVSIIPWLKLPVGDVFRFLVAHDRRHVQQALRNVPQ